MEIIPTLGTKVYMNMTYFGLFGALGHGTNLNSQLNFCNMVKWVLDCLTGGGLETGQGGVGGVGRHGSAFSIRWPT